MAERLPEQEGLLVIAEQTGQMHVRDFFPVEADPDAAAVHRVEQKLHLINTLGYLSGVSMREGAQQPAGQEAIASRYGDSAPSVAAGVDRRRVELIRQAKSSFAQATGHYALIDAEVVTKPEARRLTRGLFSDFLKKYYGVRHWQASHDYRKQLEAEVRNLTADAETNVSVFNREYGLRPHRQADRARESDIPADELEDLDSRQRLESILFDPRAGFLPKTSDAKNRVLSWLDYLDNPDKPLGIINQLREVFVRAQRPDRKPGRPGRSLGVRHGVRAVESIAWEVGDDLLEATARLQAASQLKDRTGEDQRPSLSLFDEFARPVPEESDASLEDLFGDDLSGLAAFVQYQDILEYLEAGEIKGLRHDPLMATEDPPRSVRPKFDATPGKRKTVFNQYTRPDVSEEFKSHIIERLKRTTIRDVRRGIDDCIEDLMRERTFFRRRLAELSDFKAGPSQPVQDAVETIYERLAELDTVT